MRYTFAVPGGWSRSPFPPPHHGVYLRAPAATPSPEGASILLHDAVAAAGALEDQLATLIAEGCEGAELVERGDPEPVASAAYPGLAVRARVRVDGREELRAFALLDAGAERLPVTFLGGAASLPLFEPAWRAVLASIGPLELPRDLHITWSE